MYNKGLDCYEQEGDSIFTDKQLTSLALKQPLFRDKINLTRLEMNTSLRNQINFTSQSPKNQDNF